MSKKFDFGGYATKNDLRCSDGRVIRHGAFKDCDGLTVPLVWQHQHNSPENVLGHALLENRDDGVYAYGTFNDSAAGETARELVSHGDIVSLSIYANQLKQSGMDVLHGAIREVSLVLSGANPGALIDNLGFSHSDGSFETIDDEAIIYSGEHLLLEHSEDGTDEETETGNDDDSVDDAEEESVDNDELQHAETGKTVGDVFNSMSDEQKEVVYAIIGTLMAPDDDLDDVDELDDNVKHWSYDNEEGTLMHRNVFDTTDGDESAVLTHDEMSAIFADAKKMGSLKEAVLEHGITSIESLFPEAQTVGNQPALLSRPMEWVDKVLSATRKSPFSKVKTMYADITADQARAKGYDKGTKKIEEVISALHRVTPPATIYKLQKLDRDDVLDITDFDVVSWIKQEMRVMLNEELARAILVGDGRTPGASDKIPEENIKPVWTDNEVYTTHVVVDETLTGEARAKAFIDAVIRSRKAYKGSGAPTLYIGTDLLTDLRLMRNQLGERLYKNDQELSDELRVSNIVEIELLDGLTRSTEAGTFTFGSLIVNLNDYNLGATKGGEVTLFDDFDLNFNKYEYLIETRCSGALILPKSAVAVEFGAVESGSNTEVAKPDQD